MIKRRNLIQSDRLLTTSQKSSTNRTHLQSYHSYLGNRLLIVLTDFLKECFFTLRTHKQANSLWLLDSSLYEKENSTRVFPPASSHHYGDDHRIRSKGSILVELFELMIFHYRPILRSICDLQRYSRNTSKNV